MEELRVTEERSEANALQTETEVMPPETEQPQKRQSESMSLGEKGKSSEIQDQVETECSRQKEFAYPPVGEAVPLYGVWMKTNSVERSCFDRRNGGFVGRIGPIHERVVHGLQSLTIQETGGDVGETTIRGTRGNGGPHMAELLSGSVTNPIRTDRTEANVLGKESQKNVVRATPPRTIKGDHPMANLEKNPNDDEVILSLMPNVGPSAAQMLEHPHQHVCKSRTPHQYPEPVPIEWNIGLGLQENMAQFANNSGHNALAENLLISQDKEGIQAHDNPGPGHKKRKASIHYLPIDEKGQPIPEALVRNKESDRTFAPNGSPSFVIGKNDSEAREGGRKLKSKSNSSSSKKRGRPRKSGAFSSPQKNHESGISDLIIHDHNQWNTRYVIFLFGHTVGKQIVTIDIVGGLGKDLVVWKRSPKGTFTVKEAYWQENEHKFGCTHESWKMIWSKELHPRASLFLWRMCSGALPTRDKIGSMENVKCVICEDSIESPIHVFFECHLAKTLWFGAPLPVRIDLIQGEDVKTRIMNLCSNFGRDDRLRILLCGYVVWDTIWHYRNSILHGGKNRDVPGLMAEILNRFSEMVANVVPDPVVPPQLVQQYQFGAPFNSKVLFSDGSFKDGWCGMAVIGLDRINMEWHSICSSGDGLSALEAELKAIALGLQWAIKSNWSSVTILSDCLVAVTALKGRSVPDWKLAGDFFKVLQLVDLFSSCTFLHVKRDCIFGVNDLAVQARRLRIVDSICLGDGLPPVNPIFFA
ncbi:hypothetical protein F8388_024184 [Cannabis sativa]|uniref:RNase H type-1 domain-containing protein n=1 Tax=Cannabis sativa TaxID=3483 RepID=A0A7J6FXU7_CANSA|nr:hypothetical protein F8388_024184 [Cannabis sativa]